MKFTQLSRYTYVLTGFALALSATVANSDEIALYPTGPAEDASFVRFIDGTGKGVEVKSADGKIALTAAQPATDFLQVSSKRPVKGVFMQADKRAPISVQTKPGEFASVVAVAGAQGLQVQMIHENPDDFNSLKASIGFVNLTGNTCNDAALKVAGNSTVQIFQHAKPAVVERRMVNPLKLTVQLMCAGQPTGQPLAMGQLEAGERYSVIVVPDGNTARLMLAHDKLKM
jgi:hypothetical protein